MVVNFTWRGHIIHIFIQVTAGKNQIHGYFFILYYFFFMIYIKKKQINGLVSLDQSFFDQIPFGSRNDPRKKIKRKNTLVAFGVIGVGRKCYSTGQERFFGIFIQNTKFFTGIAGKQREEFFVKFISSFTWSKYFIKETLLLRITPK